MKTKNRIAFPSNIDNKPGTAERAEITARLRIPRGKQLVEHNPWELLPDPSNPRPGESIDELWLKNALYLGSENSLCKLVGKEWVIPEFGQLKDNIGVVSESDYDELRRLAISIRNDGLIQPIEIFLADRKNEPEYFKDNDLYYAYVVIEGHRRRLASMMAGLHAIMCVEITDDTMLAKLKVKHRKLRRQLSENNLRKDLSVSQNFMIIKKLFDSLSPGEDITTPELSSITGLNVKICEALKRVIVAKPGRYPSILFDHLISNELSFKKLRILVPKDHDQIIKELSNVSKSTDEKKELRKVFSQPKKSVASFKVSGEQATLSLVNYLVRAFPYLSLLESDSPYEILENVLFQILKESTEKTIQPDPGPVE